MQFPGRRKGNVFSFVFFRKSKNIAFQKKQYIGLVLWAISGLMG